MKSKPMQCIYCCQKVNSSTGYSFDNAKWIHRDCNELVKKLKKLELDFAPNYKDPKVRYNVFDNYQQIKEMFNASDDLDKLEDEKPDDYTSAIDEYIKLEEKIISSYEEMRLSSENPENIPELTDEFKENHAVSLNRFKFVVEQYKNGVDVLHFITNNQKIFFGD